MVLISTITYLLHTWWVLGPNRDVASVPGALSVLYCAGFSDRGEALVLTRNDVGLLYVVASVLQDAIAVARGQGLGDTI